MSDVAVVSDVSVVSVVAVVFMVIVSNVGNEECPAERDRGRYKRVDHRCAQRDEGGASVPTAHHPPPPPLPLMSKQAGSVESITFGGGKMQGVE